MIWSVATVLFFAASSLGDKFISAKLRCTAAEFSFLVALSTAFFLVLLLPFIGWEFSFSGGTALAVGGLTVLKLAEFYTSASDTPFGRACYEKQFALIRSLDGSCPCSFASCKFKSDLCFGLPDVVSYNIYPLWYHDTPPAEYLADLYGWVQTTEGRGKPFLVTEIGAGGIYGFRAPYMPKWSEEYQAKALREQLGAVLSFPQCSGVYIRQFCDIRVSDEWWGGRPRTMNNKGVFDEYRRPKLCRSAVEEIFSRK